MCRIEVFKQRLDDHFLGLVDGLCLRLAFLIVEPESGICV